MKNQKRHSRKLLSILLVLCMALTIVPITAFAAGVNYIDKISVTYTKPDYKAGDAPQAAATVTEGECSVAYEYWMEIEQKQKAVSGQVQDGIGILIRVKWRLLQQTSRLHSLKQDTIIPIILYLKQIAATLSAKIQVFPQAVISLIRWLSKRILK